MATQDGVDQLPKLPAAPSSPAESFDEKKVLEKHRSSDSYLDHKIEHGSAYDEEVEYVNGEPVITSGRDVSRYLVDVRDDGDPALTFRSLFIGTVFAGLGAALCQVRLRPYSSLSRAEDILTDVTCTIQIYLFKPVQLSVSTVFLLLLIYTVGLAWAKYLPRKEWVEGTRFERLAGAIDFINPGEFRIKEVQTLCAVGWQCADRNVACYLVPGGFHGSVWQYRRHELCCSAREHPLWSRVDI